MRGKLSEVEHIASVVAFLASKDAIYINGTDIMVDDGYLAMGPEQKGEWSSFAGTKNSWSYFGLDVLLYDACCQHEV